MQHFAEDPLPDQIERHQLEAVVAAILHHDAVPARLLRRLHDRPAVVQRHRGRDLGGRVLAVPHGREHDRDVPFPRRGREDQIQILLGAHPLEVSRSAGVQGGAGWPAATTLLAARDAWVSAMSHTALTRTPGMSSMFWTWTIPCPPTPTNPMRTRMRGGGRKGPRGPPAGRRRRLGGRGARRADGESGAGPDKIATGRVVVMVCGVLGRGRGRGVVLPPRGLRASTFRVPGGLVTLCIARPLAIAPGPIWC